MCGCGDRGRGGETKREGGRCCCGLKSSFFPAVFQNETLEYKCSIFFFFLLGWPDSLSLTRAKNWKCFRSLQKKVKKAFGNTAS